MFQTNFLLKRFGGISWPHWHCQHFVSGFKVKTYHCLQITVIVKHMQEVLG